MVRVTTSLAAIAVAATHLVAAQTFSDCDPTKKSGCAARAGLNQAEYSIDFKASKGQGADQVWKNMAKAVTFGDNGAEFGLKATGDSVTYATDFYIFFGYVEVKMRAAPGVGIVSSFVLQSDDLDEVDWEMIGSETDKVQSNYFGKGNTTTYDRGGYHNVQTPADTMHTYALNWTKESTTWMIDGAVVRTVKYADALNGQNYPQTPMNVRLGNWIAGTPGNSPGTIKWAGGEADLSKGPFNMYVESVKIKNYNPAASYEYGDQSGSWQSIKFANVAPPSNSTSAASAAPPAPAAASQNSGQGKAASSVAPAASGSAAPATGSGVPKPAAPAPGKDSKDGKDGKGGKGDKNEGGHFDDDDECEDMDGSPAPGKPSGGIAAKPSGSAAPAVPAKPSGPVKPAGTVTVTPPNNKNDGGNAAPAAPSAPPKAPAAPPAPAPPAGGDAKPSTAIAVVTPVAAPSTLVASTSVPAVAVVTPSASAVVSFPLGNGTSPSSSATYTPMQVSGNAGVASAAVQTVFVAGCAALAVLVSLM